MQGSKEAFGHGVVVGAAHASHRSDHIGLSQSSAEGKRGVLRPRFVGQIL
jgi:hypothetical protein